MTSELFFKYVTKYLVPWARDREIQFPIILYVNGHASHVTFPLVQFCKQNSVKIISLYPNATCVLQPLDIAFFHPLKDLWKIEIDEFRRIIGFQPFQKEDSAPILKMAIDKLNLREIMKNSFATCGLYPFSPKNFNYKSLEDKSNTEDKINESKSGER